jgi:phage terminase Nu1 subunit (DNA packaging protein)
MGVDEFNERRLIEEKMRAETRLTNAQARKLEIENKVAEHNIAEYLNTQETISSDDI